MVHKLQVKIVEECCRKTPE